MADSSDPSTAALIVAVVVAGATLPGIVPAGATATTASEFVFLTSSTTPAQPTPGEEFTFTATFRSADGSDRPMRIERVELRDGGGSGADVLAEQSYFGGRAPALAPGGSFEQNFSIEFGEPGAHEVIVEARFRAADGSRIRATYRVTVTVYRPAPRIEVNAEPTAPGEQTTVTVNVANGLERAVRDVDLTLSSGAVSFEEGSRIAASIAGGATGTFSFTATPASLGTHPIGATLAYTTADGTRRRVTRTIDVRFRTPSFDGDVGLAADVAPALPGAETTLNLTVANGLDRTIRQLEVRIEAEGTSIRQPRRVGTGIPSGAERTFTFTVNRSTSGRQPVDVTVSYTTADGIEGRLTETLSTTFAAPTNPGEIVLTGVDAVARGGRLEISATASNVGSSRVTGVVVSIGDAAGIAPADHFVGSVDGSDFATFTLTTTVVGNVSSVPLEVTYVVGGVEKSVTAEIPVEQRAAGRPEDDGGSLPVLAIGGVIVLLAAAVVLYRRRG